MTPRDAVKVFQLRHPNSLPNFRFKTPPEPQACQCWVSEEAGPGALPAHSAQVSHIPTAIIITLIFNGQVFVDLWKSLMADF